jgi:Fe-S oxidoreductase
MFKEEEKGDKRINMERADEAIETKAELVASACPFCNTMMTDGIKNRTEELNTEVLDIAEIVAKAIQ